MESLRLQIRPVLLRLLLVAAVAVSHCCLMGHAAWAADGRAGGASAHVAPGHLPVAARDGAPMAPMACDGAHAVATTRPAVPSPGPAAVPVAATAVARGGATLWALPAYRNPPDPLPPSHAFLQTYLI